MRNTSKTRERGGAGTPGGETLKVRSFKLEENQARTESQKPRPKRELRRRGWSTVSVAAERSRRVIEALRFGQEEILRNLVTAS